VALGEQEPTAFLTSDASGKWGCGAWWNSCWFHLAWSDMACTEEVNIATKELIPIVIAAAMWGKNWEGQVVCCQCDNEAVVAVLQCLSFFEANFGFSVVAKHIPGTQNSLADDLSRDKLSSFLQARDQATLSLQSKPPEPLLNYRPDWTSPAWRGMFRDTLKMV